VSPYDGWAENTHITNECKDYYYPNNDARGLWYHDHAIGKHCYYTVTTTVITLSTAVCSATCYCRCVHAIECMRSAITVHFEPLRTCCWVSGITAVAVDPNASATHVRLCILSVAVRSLLLVKLT
jgi:hypothetical protein